MKKNNRQKGKAKSEEQDEELISAPIIMPTEDIWLSHGIDLQNRILDLTGTIAEPMSSFVLRSIIKLNNMSHDPITIYLNSAGGGLLDGMAIYDLLRASPSPIIMYATGKIMSMGIIVFLAGDERYAGKNTRFMMHESSYESKGKINESLSELKEVALQDDNTNKIVAARTKMKLKQLRDMMKDPDHYFGLAQAKKYGILTNRPKRKKK